MLKILIFLILFTFSNALEFNFKQTALDEFEVKGFSAAIVYKTKEDRDNQIAKLWEKMFSSNDFSVKKSKNKKLYVIYTNYKKNSFDCFIGIKSDLKIKNFESKLIKDSKYQRGILKYEQNLNMSDIWDEIQKEKVNRNFKTDIEEYKLFDLSKSKYDVTIYLSSK